MRISDWSSDVCSSDLAGRAVIIAYTMPLWAVMLARLTLGDPITPGRLIGLLFGLGGLAILIGPDLRALGAAPAGAAFIDRKSVVLVKSVSVRVGLGGRRIFKTKKYNNWKN